MASIGSQSVRGRLVATNPLEDLQIRSFVKHSILDVMHDVMDVFRYRRLD